MRTGVEGAGGELRRESDVDVYCYQVAGTVGVVMAAAEPQQLGTELGRIVGEKMADIAERHQVLRQQCGGRSRAQQHRDLQ